MDMKSILKTNIIMFRSEPVKIVKRCISSLISACIQAGFTHSECFQGDCFGSLTGTYFHQTSSTSVGQWEVTSVLFFSGMLLEAAGIEVEAAVENFKRDMLDIGRKQWYHIFRGLSF